MSEKPPDVTSIILALMKKPTARDQQVKVGASNISQLCSRCLADALLSTQADTSERPYWLGAWIGTSVHNGLEGLVIKFRKKWLSERKVTLGTLKGYGIIKSTLDLYIAPEETVVDFKTSTRAKMPALKEAFTTEPTPYDLSKVTEARYKATSYLYQGQLYGWGLEQEGYPVKWVSLVFINRDGVGDKDVWSHTVPYDREIALKAWDRLERLWTALQNGLDPATLPSHPQCYTCTHYREEN